MRAILLTFLALFATFIVIGALYLVNRNDLGAWEGFGIIFAVVVVSLTAAFTEGSIP